MSYGEFSCTPPCNDLLVLFQQLLQVTNHADRDYDCRTSHSDKEQWDDNPCD
ncbi:hypothetical protein [Granulicella sp. dw_53]|uniref:hypothetical protein n=1 Tax=Granulicella sp. dw_53 TaxID=2719792 RepID=UPI001BD2D57E|nr:hypothetical protein [Granulicella sp. dw_53]